MARRPVMLKLLSRYGDGASGTMADAWKTPDERAAERAAQATMVFNSVKAALGNTDQIDALRNTLAKDPLSLLDQFIEDRVNVFTASLELMSHVTAVAGAIIEMLKVRPHTRDELIAGTLLRASLSASTVKRKVIAHLTLFTAANRIRMQTPSKVYELV